MLELNVPYLEKDEAKRLGARWNAASKRWYVPAGLDYQPFQRWLSDDARSKIAIAEIEGVSANVSNAAVTDTLAVFLRKIADLVNNNFTGTYWLSAEISELRENKGHCFITLVEHDELGNMVARSSAKIWQTRLGYIYDKFKAGTGADLTAGIKVLIAVNVEFHQQYGLSLSLHDIDPSYTLGDMAAKIAKIREVLIYEKIYALNKQCPKPTDFTRVAVVSPANAAGLGDFNREAELLKKHGLCEFVYFTATFQGETAGEQICAAIQAAIMAHEQQGFDALVIIRGGGAISDLAWLNNERLARAVCLCPIMVMCGIGHERDFTIIDEVAGEKFDTPSKVIQRIFNIIVNNATLADTQYLDILKHVKHVYQHTAYKLDKSMQEIVQMAKSNLDIVTNKIQMLYEQLGVQAKQICNSLQQQIQSVISEILSQNPDNILRKGFALVFNHEQKVITSGVVASKEARLSIRFHDAQVEVFTVKE